MPESKEERKGMFSPSEASSVKTPTGGATMAVSSVVAAPASGNTVLVAAAGQPKVQRIIMSNNKDQLQFKAIRNKLQELETVCTGLKADMANLNTKELTDKLAEISQTLEKKASILDLKKMYGSLDDNNGRFEDIKKELLGIQKSIKTLEEGEELKAQKLRITSLESKLTSGLKNMKDLQAKLAETMTLQIMPQTQQMNEEEKKEDKISQFMDEINEKVNKVSATIAQFKLDFANLSKGVDDKVEIKASKESLIDLESISWKHYQISQM